MYVSVASQPIETAMEAREPPPPDVVKLCRETFQNTADYLKGELEGKNKYTSSYAHCLVFTIMKKYVRH